MNKMIAELKALDPQERFKAICGIINQENDDNILRSKLTAIFETFQFALTQTLYEECGGDKKKLIELIIKNRHNEIHSDN